LIAALPKLIEASWRKLQTGSGMVKWRLHAHFEVDRYVPARIDVTPNPVALLGSGWRPDCRLATIHL
jgi:hypothetical protein